jgi:hypothetical protein
VGVPPTAARTYRHREVEGELMPYEVVVRGGASRTIPAALKDLGVTIVSTPGTDAFVVRVVDQAVMVGLIDHLHRLGTTIDQVRHSSQPEA